MASPHKLYLYLAINAAVIGSLGIMLKSSGVRILFFGRFDLRLANFDLRLANVVADSRYLPLAERTIEEMLELFVRYLLLPHR